MNNRKIKIVTANGDTTSFIYDANGNPTAVLQPDQSEVRFFYDALNRKIGKQNELGAQELFEYDGTGNIVAHTDALGNITQYEYDAVGWLVKTIDAKGYYTMAAYDEAGRKLSSTNALGVVTDMQYDVRGNLLKHTLALGTDEEAVTRFEYDDNNRKVFDIRELKLDGGGTRDLVTEYQYDDRGLLRFRVDGQHLYTDAETSEYRYNARRELYEIVDPEGNVTTFTYDKAGRKIKSSVTTAANGPAEHLWEYDEAGNIILETLPEGETIVRGYDAMDRPNFVLKGSDQRHMDYGSRGWLMQDVNFNNETTQYAYDAVGRILLKIAAKDTTDHATNTYTYDDNGNVLTITNARDKVISYEYNALNQKIGKTDSDATFQVFAYDANGALESVERQDGSVVTYVRDNQGRTTQIRVNGSLRQTFGYDSLSRMILATDNNAGRITHTVTFDYNDLSRPEKEIQDSYTLFRQFDANGNKTKITYPSARVVDKAYDENNMLTDISFQGNVAAQATYDKNSRLAYASFGNGADLSLSYDAARGRENDRSVTTPSADPLFRVSGMVYDGQGNITDRIETFNGTAVDEDLAFDHLDRLVSYTRGMAPSLTWEYDKVGNWEGTNQNGAYETRTVTDDNEYALIDTLFPVHDNRGNMTFDGVQAYENDWANRLVKVSSGPQILAEYTYDALNRRVTKTTATAATTYVYDGGDVVEEYTGGTLVRAFAFGAAIDDPILMEYNGQTYYYAKDTLGSIRVITDANGLLVESYDYGPFGLMTVFDGSGQDITATGSTVGNPYGFAGRRWDGESGLWYYRNRMYSAELGRFLQRDPAGYVDGLNLYAYVLNNPLRYTDPNGLAAKATAQVAYDTVKFANDYIAAPLVNPVLYNVVAPTINQFNSLVETGINFSNKYVGTTDQDFATLGLFLDAVTGIGFKSASMAVGILASTSKLKKISTVASKSSAKTWNEFQKRTKGQFSSRAEAGKAWSAYKDANGITIGTVRSQAQKSAYLKQVAESGKAPKYMNQWLKKGKVPPGHQVDHIQPLSVGGKDVPSNMRLQGTDLHKTHHQYYRPWQ